VPTRLPPSEAFFGSSSPAIDGASGFWQARRCARGRERLVKKVPTARYSLEGNSPRLVLPITLAQVLWALIEGLDYVDHRRPYLLRSLKALEQAFRLKPTGPAIGSEELPECLVEDSV
jgi:hypothetical protein